MLCFSNKDYRWIRLLHKEQHHNPSDKAHDGGKIFGPAPAEVASRDETADDGAEERTAENHHGEKADCNAALGGMEDL